MSKIDELIATTKLNDLINKKEEESFQDSSLDTGSDRCCGSSCSNRICSILLLYPGLSGRL